MKLIFLGYWLSVITKRVFVIGNPFSVTIEPTNICNLSCPECPTGNQSSQRVKGQMNMDLYEKIINDIKDYAIYQMIYFQGEPFLNPELFEMIKYSDSNKIYTITSTNGHFLNQENNIKIIQSGLKEIIISVDGLSQDIYEKYRCGGNFERVISGIKNLVETKIKFNSKFPIIRIQFLVMKHNEYEIVGLKNQFKSLGINKIELKSIQIEDFNKNGYLLPNWKKYSRYIKLGNQYKIKSKLKNRCFRLWSTLVITWDGIVVLCCFDKDQKYSMGDIKSNKAKFIWKSTSFRSFRKNILDNRKNIEICRNCTTGLRIKY